MSGDRIPDDICAASPAQFGYTTQGIVPGPQPPAAHGSANVEGAPVDGVRIESGSHLLTPDRERSSGEA